MFSKVNYDVISNGKVTKYRWQECFGGYTHNTGTNSIHGFKHHKVIIYIPQYYFYSHHIKTIFDGNGYAYGYKGSFNKASGTIAEEKVIKWGEWLQSIGIPLTILDPIEGNDDTLIESRVSKGYTLPCEITIPIEKYQIYRYEIDLSKANTIAQAKFFLFMARYFSLPLNREIIDFAFNFKEENPEISEWESILFAEYMIAKFKNSSTSEYYVFSRFHSFVPYVSYENYFEKLNWNYENMDEIQRQIRPLLDSPNINNEISTKLKSEINKLKTKLEQFNYWKEFKYEL